jgi:hypothetical protein
MLGIHTPYVIILIKVSVSNGSWDSSASIVTKLRAGRSVFDSWQKQGFFSLRHCVQTSSGAHPASSPIGTWWFSPAVKRPEREAGNSSSLSAEVKTTWSYTSTPQYFFMAWCLIKHWIRIHGFYLYLILQVRTSWECEVLVFNWSIALNKQHSIGTLPLTDNHIVTQKSEE